nr:MAG TPA: hypothetical protein [Caudoviricetes sp.]
MYNRLMDMNVKEINLLYGGSLYFSNCSLVGC